MKCCQKDVKIRRLKWENQHQKRRLLTQILPYHPQMNLTHQEINKFQFKSKVLVHSLSLKRWRLKFRYWIIKLMRMRILGLG